MGVAAATAGLNTEYFLQANREVAGLLMFDDARDVAARLKLVERENHILKNQVRALLKKNAVLEAEATIDELTKALNRRAIECAAKKMISKSRRRKNKNEKEYITFIFFDIDHFKKINDTYGHDVGDKALRVLVERVNSVKRNEDCLGRYGGEEFLFVGCTSGRRAAHALARRLQKAIVQRPVNGTGVRITVSAGVYFFDPLEEKVAVPEAIRRADILLYNAKNEGRYAIRANNYPPQLSRLDKRYQPA